MRTLETAAVLIYVIYVLILLAPSQRRGRWHAWIGIAADIVAVAQAAIEGYRWQMLPLDVVIAITAILSLLSLLKRTTSPSPRRFAFRIGQTALGLLLAVLVAAPAMLFPVPVLPIPTGPYAVGTLSFALTDASRIDPYAPNPGTPRELLARVWYPAQTTAAPNAPWVSGIERITGAFARSGGLPSFFFSHLVYARAHSVQDAPLAAAEPQYPVLHFSHGLGGITSQDTFLVEELASRGYIVVSTLHPYAALDAVFPDGHIVPYNPAVLPKDTKSEEYTRAALRLGRQWTQAQRHDLRRRHPLPGLSELARQPEGPAQPDLAARQRRAHRPCRAQQQRLGRRLLGAGLRQHRRADVSGVHVRRPGLRQLRQE